VTEAGQIPDVPGESTYVPRILQLDGRIGRARYLAYGLVLNLVLVACLMVVAIASGGAGDGSFTQLTYGAAALVASVILGRRRLHDLGRTSWFAALLLVPVVNLFIGLWLVVVRGNRDANRFGPAPAPNSRAVLVLAWLVPVLFIAGIVAAVVMSPAPSSYERTRAEMEQAV
jgi:uncharacterized membrane protein YhaH (DUF805 family)